MTCVASSVAWCFCSACTSLLTSCCGNDKFSTLPPSVTSGRKRSVGLLVLAIVLALAFQYGVGPAIVDRPNLPYLHDAWVVGCPDSSIGLTKACAGNSGAYRPLFASTIFFLLAALASYCKPTANREAWPAKLVLFIFGVVGMVFVPNKPLFDEIFLNVARGECCQSFFAGRPAGWLAGWQSSH